MTLDASAVRRLGGADVDEFRRVRLAALLNSPEAFGSTYASEVVDPVPRHMERLTKSAVFGAFDDRQVVGMAGWARKSGPKETHKGFVWGVYVDPVSRGRGLGAALMTALIAAARIEVEQLTLSVVRGNCAAVGLYARFGFVQYGIEPRALKTDLSYVDEVLMALVF